MNDPAEPAPPTDESTLDARLVFEVSGVTLALPLAAVGRVLEARPIRRIPHRTGEGILGIVHVDGDLRLCGSLAALCGLRGTTHAVPPTPSRCLVLGSGNRAWVAPIEKVIGIAEVPPGRAVEPPPQTGDVRAAAVASVFEHEGREVLLLDPDRLLGEFERRLS